LKFHESSTNEVKNLYVKAIDNKTEKEENMESSTNDVKNLNVKALDNKTEKEENMDELLDSASENP